MTLGVERDANQHSLTRQDRGVCVIVALCIEGGDVGHRTEEVGDAVDDVGGGGKWAGRGRTEPITWFVSVCPYLDVMCMKLPTGCWWPSPAPYAARLARHRRRLTEYHLTRINPSLQGLKELPHSLSEDWNLHAFGLLSTLRNYERNTLTDTPSSPRPLP